MTAVATLVASGIKLLDNRRPNWRTSVNVKRLDIQDANACILGQVYGEYWYGTTVLGINDHMFSGWRYGFCPNGDEHNGASARQYAELQVEWVRVLTNA